MKARSPYCQKRGLAKGKLFVSDEGACWVPTLHKGEEVGQGSSKGFTYTEEISYIGLVDFIWNVYKGGAVECLFCHPPPEECTDEAINLLVGNSKSRHRPFSMASHCRSVMGGAAHFARQLLWPFEPHFDGRTHQYTPSAA